LYYPTFSLKKDGQDGKKEATKEKVSITEKDKDLFLMVKKLETYYKQRGVSYRLSKKGKKHLKHAVGFLNAYWKEREKNKELSAFNTKGEMYEDYINHTFRNLADNTLQHVKRLTFSATKSSWKTSLKKEHSTFTPYILKPSFSSTIFYGLDKREIPKDPKEKGYWTTVDTFLLKKWRTKSYPLCKQVLYALERVIVAHIYRKQSVKDLVEKHNEYLNEYKRAEKRGELDDLMEYINEGKKREEVNE
jgi:hypothetical protein